MKKNFPVLAILQLMSLMATAQVQLQNLQTENLHNPIGIDAARPRFSWQLASDKRGVLQTAYEIKLTTAEKGGGWNSGKISSDQSTHVLYDGPALHSDSRYNWQVRVWDNTGKASAWSTPAFFQTGFLQSTDWKAQWITPGFTEDSLRASPLFRKEFTSAKKIRSATAYITAHGLYEAQLNGKRVGDAYLTPGWTSYNKRLQYQVYDVTNLLQQGRNAIGVVLGSGWYRGYLAWGDQHNIYGKDIALLFQLNITYTDGS